MAARMRSSGWVAAAIVAGLSGSASGFVSWTQPNGAGSFFTYSQGGSDNGLFGDPTLIAGNTFAFFPQNYLASGSDGASGSTTDRLQVRLDANAGHRFTAIRIREFGDWSITGIGSVSASGTMDIYDLVSPRPPARDSLDTTPGMPIQTSNDSGQWSGTAFIDLTQIIGPDWTSVMLVFTNHLQTTSSPGGTSLIQKALVDGPAITVEVLPAPGTAAVLGLGALALGRRRRS